MDLRVDHAYFGCWGQAGHYMFMQGKREISDIQCEQSNIPKGHQLDGSFLFLPRPEIPDHGRLTYLSAMNVTVLSWWNSLYDKRSKVNSHFIMRGEISVASMWHMFKHYFPELHAAHTKPFIGVTY